MKNEISNNDTIKIKRLIYTPSEFANRSLLHIQEIGTLQAKQVHTSKRASLNSYLFFVVLSGSGKLHYESTTYELSAGDCVFIDCKNSYYHETSADLWKLSWVHFTGPSAEEIYQKYTERGGKPTFHTGSVNAYISICERIYDIASGTGYVRDMEINEHLAALLTLLMKDSWQNDDATPIQTGYNLAEIKTYLDDNYTQKIALSDVAERYFINKYYLTRIFRKQYGTSINNYILQKRITHAKQELRFSDKPVEEIGLECGIGELYYFSRVFKQVEGISPSGFRKEWRG